MADELDPAARALVQSYLDDKAAPPNEAVKTLVATLRNLRDEGVAATQRRQTLKEMLDEVSENIVRLSGSVDTVANLIARMAQGSSEATTAQAPSPSFAGTDVAKPQEANFSAGDDVAAERSSN